MVLGVLLPSYVGIQVDRHYGTGKLWLLVGFALGVAHGVRAVYRALKQANQAAEAEEEEMRRRRQDYHDERRQNPKV
jgi:F0F1-type ATP synthase assembly protein I